MDFQSIRRGSDPYRETYWVALAMGRNDKNPSFALDLLSNWPKTRKAMLRALYFGGFIIEYMGKLISFRALTELGFKIKTGSILTHTISHYGLAVELDAEGKILQSLHSPDGRTTLLSEVREVIVGDRKVLYLGSYGNNYVGMMTLGHLIHLNRPLLTHEKKQYIEHKKKKSGEKSKPKKWEPYEPFDLQNPHFGPAQQRPQHSSRGRNPYDQNPYDDYDFTRPKSSKMKSKQKSGSKKKSSKKSKTKKKSNQKTPSKSKSDKKPKTETKPKLDPISEPKVESQPKSIPESIPEPKLESIPEFKPNIETKSEEESKKASKLDSKAKTEL